MKTDARQDLVTHRGCQHYRRKPLQYGWTAVPLLQIGLKVCVGHEIAMCHANGLLVPPARTSSTTTVTQIQGMSEPLSSETPTTPKEHGFSSRRLSARRDRPALAVLQKAPQVEEESPPLSSSDDSESESELEDSVPNRRISGVRRFGKYSMQKPSLRDDEDDDDDDSPAFLPLSRNTPTGGRDTHNRDLNSTLRLETATVDAQRRRPEHIPMSRRSIPQTTSLDSSASSGVAVGSPRTGPQREAGPFSPQRVSGLSRPSHRRPASANQSSEETKSMGSSFSDLDGEFLGLPQQPGALTVFPDASVTQSALEEALLSGMQHGGMASRVSTISQVLRSRYL